MLAALLQRHKHHCTKDHEKKRFPNIRSLGDIVGAPSKRHSEDGGGTLRNWFARNSFDASLNKKDPDVSKQDSLTSQKALSAGRQPSDFSQSSNMSISIGEEPHQKVTTMCV